jgi:hypothetical protein
MITHFCLMKRLRSSSSVGREKAKIDKSSALRLLIDAEMIDVLLVIVDKLDAAEVRSVAQVCRTLHTVVQKDLNKYNYWVVPYMLPGSSLLDESYIITEKVSLISYAEALRCILADERARGNLTEGDDDVNVYLPTMIDVTNPKSRTWWLASGPPSYMPFPLISLDFARAAAEEAKRRERRAWCRSWHRN